jgi:hypothetical protein
LLLLPLLLLPLRLQLLLPAWPSRPLPQQLQLPLLSQQQQSLP